MTFCESKGGIPYFETSAKEALNVEQAFEGIHLPWGNMHGNMSWNCADKLDFQSSRDKH